MHRDRVGAENPAEAQRWTPAEAARFLAHVVDDPMGLMFRVMVLRGCRRVELCGFRGFLPTLTGVCLP